LNALLAVWLRLQGSVWHKICRDARQANEGVAGGVAAGVVAAGQSMAAGVTAGVAAGAKLGKSLLSGLRR
jgi:hypothetical protein